MKISVIGLGKLGSPILAVLAIKGHQVIGVDLNQDFCTKISKGIAPVEEPFLQDLLTDNLSRISATSDYDSAIFNTDATFVIVPTPSGTDGYFSNEFLLQSMKKMGESLRKKKGYHLVVIKSTVMPGSTGGVIQAALESASQKTVGDQLGLCYSPEFIALGNVVKNLLRPDLVLIGESDAYAGDILEKIYHSTCDNSPTIRRMNFINAELSKIAINTFVTTKISYANMLSDVCQHLEGADVEVVTQAVGVDSRIGSKYLKAGVAFGGPCFPRDNTAFAALAQKIGARADLAEATQKLNQFQNDRLLALIEQTAQTTRIGILGLAYKPGTSVVEESQSIHLANQLSQKGYSVSVYDPMAHEEAKKVLINNIQFASSIHDCFNLADTLIIMTPWQEFSTKITPSLAKDKTLIDCWRILKQSEFENISNLIYLGFGYPLNETITI